MSKLDIEGSRPALGAQPRVLDLRAPRTAAQRVERSPAGERPPAIARPRAADAEASEAGAIARWWNGPDPSFHSPLSPPHLLVVDDDASDTALIRLALAEVPGTECSVTTAVRLADARSLIAGTAFDCVLLDLSLPDSAGLDTISGIVLAAPDVPVVVLTGLEDELTALVAVQAGAQDYLSKRALNGPLLWRTVRYAIERKRAEVNARHNALHDPLTGLANRVLFVERLVHALVQLEREPGRVAVLFIDLDRFKWINDSLGHAAGDALLIAVARRLENMLRPQDLAARLGGDELLVLCENISSEFAAMELAERILGALDNPFEIGDTELWISASIGIAISQDAGDSPTDLIRDADTAMYRAKDRGKARCELYDVQMRDRAETRLRVSNDLHRALDAGEFTVHYQPVVDLTDGQPVGAEALVRWQHPDGHLVLPGEFIAVAEETGLIISLGDLVLDAACRRLALWQADTSRAHAPIVTVNVSALQLADASFARRVEAALNASGADPTGLGLEVTESSLMRDEEGSLERLREVKELGIRLYMDDFGTGYSSLTYLKRFPFDALKIDTSFIGGLGIDDQDVAIVEAVIGLARSLRLAVVAEGIETAQQLHRLRALECPLGQGYYFGRPSPDGELDRHPDLPDAARPAGSPTADSMLTPVPGVPARRRIERRKPA
jgi:diguanylate cyclase (GGDEF)-like protein